MGPPPHPKDGQGPSGCRRSSPKKQDVHWSRTAEACNQIAVVIASLTNALGTRGDVVDQRGRSKHMAIPRRTSAWLHVASSRHHAVAQNVPERRLVGGMEESAERGLLLGGQGRSCEPHIKVGIRMPRHRLHQAHVSDAPGTFRDDQAEPGAWSAPRSPRQCP